MNSLIDLIGYLYFFVLDRVGITIGSYGVGLSSFLRVSFFFSSSPEFFLFLSLILLVTS